MKLMHKMISILLAAAIIMGMSASVIAIDTAQNDAPLLSSLNSVSVTQAVARYFEARADYLLGNRASMGWPVVGIVNDEAAHAAQYRLKGIILQETNYTIENANCNDRFAEVDAVETITYTKNGVAGTEEILHKLTLYLSDAGVPIVAADGYMELCSGFESCSYLPPDTRSGTNTAEEGSSLCIVKVAEAEIGTVEGANDNTKYGEWFGLNYNPWCAMFICWCADQANVDISIIPLIAGVDTMLDWFDNRDQYYRSPAYGGTYTPQPGDIIFIGDAMDNPYHVGLVEKVADGKVWIIDGNWSDRVRYRSYSLTASDIVGYGNPAYESSNHTYSGWMTDTQYHWKECVTCGYQIHKTEHTTQGEYYHDSASHWKICDFCGVEFARAEHIAIQNADGNHTCKSCGAYIPISLRSLRMCLEG